jgi:hypothetical protein
LNFGLPAFLHERDAAANTFEHLFPDQPRTDAPRNLTASVPSYPSRAARKAVVSEHAQGAPSDYQRRLMALADSFQRPQTQGRAVQVVAKQVAAQQRRAPGGERRPARRGRAKAKKTAPSRGRSNWPHGGVGWLVTRPDAVGAVLGGGPSPDRGRDVDETET